MIRGMKISRFLTIFLIGIITFYGVGIISGEDVKSITHIITSLILALFVAIVFEYFYAKK
jgi:hypothetical protein